MNLIVGMVFDNEKVVTKINIIIVLVKKHMLETDSDVFADCFIKSFMKEYNDIDKKMEGSRFSFNPKIALIVFYIDVKILTYLNLIKNRRAIIHESLNQSYVSNQYYKGKIGLFVNNFRH